MASQRRPRNQGLNEVLLDKSKRGGKHKATKDKRSHKLAEERELQQELRVILK